MKAESLDYYQVLGVSPTASAEEIHSAYRMLARQYHPDRNPSPRAAVSMALLNEAFAVLSDTGRRAAYNRDRRSNAPAEVDLFIIEAARSVVLRSKWKVNESLSNDLVLGSDKQEMFVRLLPRLGETELHTWIQDTERLLRRRALTMAVLLASKLAVGSEQIPRATPRNRIPVAVIDLTRGEIVGNDFPDPQFKSPFEYFLRSSKAY
jgi:curved DNA-binding protein CbpA